MSKDKRASDTSLEKARRMHDRLAAELHSRLRVGYAGDVDGAGSLLQPNWEVTEKLQKQDKYLRFNAWAKENGVRAPALDWPVAYGPRGELVGARATRDVGPMESYVYVPVKLTLNVEQF